MDEKQKQLTDEFKSLCTPINDWLQENYSPHTRIIIENNNAEIIESVTRVSFEVKD